MVDEAGKYLLEKGVHQPELVNAITENVVKVVANELTIKRAKQVEQIINIRFTKCRLHLY